MSIGMAYVVLRYLALSFGLLMCAAGLVGAALVATTRGDAFSAADRHDKWIWFGILVGSALVQLIHVPFLSWIGIVIIGLYWFDVRPQIKDILEGNYGW